MPELTLKQNVVYAPAFRQRPVRTPDKHVAFEQASGTVTAYIAHKVIKKVTQGTFAAAPNEAIGFLAGRAFEDREGIWILVEEAFVCDHADRTSTYVEASEQDHIELSEWFQQKGLGMDRLGWWHSHYELNFGVYSGVDRDNQSIWCSCDWQIGLLVLVDQGKVRLRCYQGPESTQLGGMLVHKNKSSSRNRRQLALQHDSFSDPIEPTPDFPYLPPGFLKQLVPPRKPKLNALQRGLMASWSTLKRIPLSLQASLYCGAMTLLTGKTPRYPDAYSADESRKGSQQPEYEGEL